MTMKRYFLLFLSTALVIGSLTAAGFTMKPHAVAVRTWSLHSTSVLDTLLCNGTVVRAKERSVAFSKNIRIEEVFVEKGEQVSAGQALFSYQASSTPSTSAQQQTYAELWEEYQKTGQVPADVETILAGMGESAPLEEEYGELQTAVSPIDGAVTALDIQPGEILPMGNSAAVIADPDNLKIELQINEANISKIQVGQQAEITGSGFPETQYQAEVVSISDEAVVQTSTSGKESVVEVILKVLSPDEKIKPGYTVKASVVTECLEDAVQIPYDAVFADEEGKEYIYIVDHNRAKIQPITTIKEYTSGIVIEEELEEGTSIILEPEHITEGSYVKCFETEAFAND